MFVCAFGSLTLQNCPLQMMLCTSVHLSWVISKPLQNDEHRKEAESQGYCLSFLLCHPVPHTYTQAEGKGEIRSHWQKKLKKKKMSHWCNWMCGWFVVFQCCFDGYLMLLELKSPRDTNNFSFQFIRPLVFFFLFFAGVGLGWAERGHFLLLVMFTLGLPPLPPHRVTWVKAMESCVASTSNCSSPKWSFMSKWVVLTYNASGSRVARYGAVF